MNSADMLRPCCNGRSDRAVMELRDASWPIAVPPGATDARLGNARPPRTRIPHPRRRTVTRIAPNRTSPRTARTARSVVVAALVITAASSVATASPEVTIAPPTVTGAMSVGAVTSRLQSMQGSLLRCYRRVLASDPVAAGEAITSFTLGADGRVTSVAVVGDVGEAIERCVTRAIRPLRFPRSFDRRSAHVVVAIGLSARGSGDAPVPPRAADHDAMRAAIRRNLASVRSCYDPEAPVATTPRGDRKLELVVGADGTVVSTDVRGLGAPHVDACVAKALRAMRFPKPAGGGTLKISYPL